MAVHLKRVEANFEHWLGPVLGLGFGLGLGLGQKLELGVKDGVKDKGLG